MLMTWCGDVTRLQQPQQRRQRKRRRWRLQRRRCCCCCHQVHQLHHSGHPVSYQWIVAARSAHVASQGARGLEAARWLALNISVRYQ